MKRFLAIFIFIFITDFMFSTILKNENYIFLKAENKTEIKAITDGIVKDIGFDIQYGLYIKIEYNIGISLTYCNLDSIYLTKNQSIERNQNIAKVGCTGNTLEYGTTIFMEINENLILGNACTNSL